MTANSHSKITNKWLNHDVVDRIERITALHWKNIQYRTGGTKIKKKYVLDVHDKHYGFLNNQKCAKQRAKRGYCERDVYEINTWFLCIIPEMLDELNKKRNNYPATLLAEFYQKNKDWIVGTEKEFSLGQNEANKVIYEEATSWCEKRWN